MRSQGEHEAGQACQVLPPPSFLIVFEPALWGTAKVSRKAIRKDVCARWKYARGEEWMLLKNAECSSSIACGEREVHVGRKDALLVVCSSRSNGRLMHSVIARAQECDRSHFVVFVCLIDA